MDTVPSMTTRVNAVYENGMLRLPGPLPLPEKAHVWVTIQTDPQEYPEPERGAWLRLSEEALTKTWDNSDDDVFNELLAK
jgi:hypothetical protein